MVAVDHALALRVRAEIHALRGEVDLAHHDLDALGALRGFVPNAIHDAEDLRVVALLRAAEGDLAAAERALHEVIQRAEVYRQPQLQAQATRDLATVLRRAGQHAKATVSIDRPQGQSDPVAARCISGSQTQVSLHHRSRSSTRSGMVPALPTNEGSPSASTATRSIA